MNFNYTKGRFAAHDVVSEKQNFAQGEITLLEASFMDFDAEHLTPATFIRHCQINLSGILGSTHHVISRRHVTLHLTPKQARRFQAVLPPART